MTQDSGRLSANSIRVVGNVQSEGHRRVKVVTSRLGGSIQLKQGGDINLRSNELPSARGVRLNIV